MRAAGNFGEVSDDLDRRIAALANDESADVQLQVAIAAAKIADIDTMPVLLDILAHCGDDPLIPHIVWQNLHPRLHEQPERFMEMLSQRDFKQNSNIMALLPRVLDRLLAVKKRGPESAAKVYCTLITGNSDQAVPNDSLVTLAERIQTGELAGDRLARLRAILQPEMQPLLNDPAAPLHADAVFVAASWGDKASLDRCRQFFESTEPPTPNRIRALDVLASRNDESILPTVQGILTDPQHQEQSFRAAIVATLGQMQAPDVADVILTSYPALEPELQPNAIELLTERSSWSRKLLKAVEAKKIPAGAINVNQVRKLLASRDKGLVDKVHAVWGTVRTKRDPNREQVLAQMRTFLRETPGDAAHGQEVFHKLCGQCHVIHGKGADIGPDITVNGRASYEQLLSNVFDPSLVIGAAYRATIVATTEGRVVTGLVVEDNDQRIVLKVQGGKLETIPRDQIEERIVSKLSLMPENLESQLKPQELADLFEFLTLSAPPDDPQARRIPGIPRHNQPTAAPGTEAQGP